VGDAGGMQDLAPVLDTTAVPRLFNADATRSRADQPGTRVAQSFPSACRSRHSSPCGRCERECRSARERDALRCDRLGGSAENVHGSLTKQGGREGRLSAHAQLQGDAKACAGLRENATRVATRVRALRCDRPTWRIGRQRSWLAEAGWEGRKAIREEAGRALE